MRGILIDLYSPINLFDEALKIELSPSITISNHLLREVGFANPFVLMLFFIKNIKLYQCHF